MGNILPSMDDFVGAGFERLDDEVAQHPPRIQWGKLVQAMGPTERMRYLERIAETMNHAAAKIQGERNALLKLCGLKEQQLKAMAGQVEANNQMLQTEVTRLNEDRQLMIDTIASLRRKLRKAEA